MKALNITIDVHEVWREAAALSEYAGVAAGASVASDGTTDGDGWDDTRMTEGVRDDLARFFGEAESVLSERLSEWLAGVSSSGHTRGYKFLLADGWKEALADEAKGAMESYFVNAVAARWFRFTSGDMSNVYATDSTGALDTLASLLCVRCRPQRSSERKEDAGDE